MISESGEDEIKMFIQEFFLEVQIILLGTYMIFLIGLTFKKTTSRVTKFHIHRFMVHTPTLVDLYSYVFLH